jgi:hypothetical protein
LIFELFVLLVGQAHVEVVHVVLRVSLIPRSVRWGGGSWLFFLRHSFAVASSAFR